MCGIAGIVGLEAKEETLDLMQQTMVRRGPDAAGRYRSTQSVLIHTRLAVVDLKRGAQPMVLSWSGDHYVLVYNGELYNTPEIREELMGLGHVFVGHSDSEVLLHAYAQWREACLEKLNGIFAFAVWEERQQKLFVARDRMGVKPLFYKLHNGGLIFASEIKTILKYPTVNAELDQQGIAQILLLGPGRMPGSGVFRDIYELEPGCCGAYRAGKWCWRRYWKLKDGEHVDSFDQTVESVRYLVTDSILRQTVSDFPIGTFLSGGLDSSIISAICSTHVKNRGELLHTFSLDYEDNDKYFQSGKFQPDSDNKYIDIMNEAIDSDHHWTVLSPDALVETLQEAVIARDLPGMADVDSSLLVFCKDVRKHVKVALSGECADEIFGGYPWYRDPEVRLQEGFPWAQNATQRIALMHPCYSEKINGIDFIMSAYADTVKDTDVLPGIAPTEKRMKEMINLNYRWFMQTLLDRKDRMSMYSGLEVRVPFCDYRIAEYLYTVPWEFKDYKGREKGLLRRAVAGLLPDEVLWRKKSPYPKTYDPRYENAVTERYKNLLSDQQAPVFQIINKSEAASLLEGQFKWPWYGQLMKRPQTLAYILMINMWLKAYNVRIIE